MIQYGCPSFYITINPADIYNLVVKFMGGSQFDLDNMQTSDLPQYWEQSKLIACNPVVGATFFDTYFRAFLACTLGWDEHARIGRNSMLGNVQAFYGCVEAQGRGSLHCHMLVWLHGGMNPDNIRERVFVKKNTEFKECLLAYLDDSISNSVPSDPGDHIVVPSTDHHPCAVRGIDVNESATTIGADRVQKDMHHLVTACQVHKHTYTCYKYWKGLPEPRECRFGLDEKHICAASYYDEDTQEICLWCLDGLVNNFNETILCTIRCNMDIKFIGSEAAAKAVLYYITDYITKTQLKAHVAYAALNLAVHKLGDPASDNAEDDTQARAKHLLQKCAYCTACCLNKSCLPSRSPPT